MIAIGNLFNQLIGLYTMIVFASVIASWLVAFNVVNTQNRFVYSVGNALFQLTEPVVGRIRKFLPSAGGIDFSPMVVIIALIFLQRVVLPSLARSMGTGM